MKLRNSIVQLINCQIKKKKKIDKRNDVVAILMTLYDLAVL